MPHPHLPSWSDMTKCSINSRETKKEIQQQFKNMIKETDGHEIIPLLHSLISCIIGNLVSFWTSIKGIYLRNEFHFSVTIYLEEILKKKHFWTLLLNKGFISAQIVHTRGYQLVPELFLKPSDTLPS